MGITIDIRWAQQWMYNRHNDGHAMDAIIYNGCTIGIITDAQ
jgi:hypothetical protein